MSKFHITKAGRTEPCGATVRACPLGEANHYDSLAEAVQASMLPTNVRKRDEFDAKTAPYELRRFFMIDEGDDEDEESSIFFASRSAYRRLVGAELGEFFAEAIEDTPVGLTLRDGLKRLAAADFENDEAWQSSDERRVMASEVPELLARLEDQAEEAAIYRMLHG